MIEGPEQSGDTGRGEEDEIAFATGRGEIRGHYFAMLVLAGTPLG